MQSILTPKQDNVKEWITSIADNQNLYITKDNNVNIWLHCNNLISPI